jgi:hypothetical protein
MDIDDQDYNLSMDELIKVAKILFHKINFNTKRIKLVLAESKHETDLRVAQAERVLRSSNEEVNTFLTNVHSDFETFLKKHKVDHKELNLKIAKLSEVGHRTLDNVD